MTGAHTAAQPGPESGPGSGSAPRIGLVWAEAAGGVIGRDGVMPWHVPEDLAHFRLVTLGSPVVMGRRTWDSLPPRFRPLPGRRNIVVTRQAGWRADGAEAAHSVTDALGLAAADSRADAGEGGGVVWVIGGAEIFSAVIDTAERLEVTELNATIEGDTLAPAISGDWSVATVDPAEGWHTSRGGLEYRFVGYVRR